MRKALKRLYILKYTPMVYMITMMSYWLLKIFKNVVSNDIQNNIYVIKDLMKSVEYAHFATTLWVVSTITLNVMLEIKGGKKDE